MVEAVLSLTIPLLGTTLGAALVFLVRDKLPVRLEKLLLGFAGGIMTAAVDGLRCAAALMEQNAPSAAL